MKYCLCHRKTGPFILRSIIFFPGTFIRSTSRVHNLCGFPLSSWALVWPRVGSLRSAYMRIQSYILRSTVYVLKKILRSEYLHFTTTAVQQVFFFFFKTLIDCRSNGRFPLLRCAYLILDFLHHSRMGNLEVLNQTRCSRPFLGAVWWRPLHEMVAGFPVTLLDQT